MPKSDVVLSVRNLRIVHRDPQGRQRQIVTGVDLDVARGETVGIVGESGSGKSLSARAIMRLLPANLYAEGSARFREAELLSVAARRVAELRGTGISMLFQDPFTMLNPLMRAGEHIEEVLKLGATRQRGGRSARREEVGRRLAEVGITDPDAARRYPFQLSGGMRQRVALATALARDPELLIADEPSTALDVTTQKEVLRLLQKIQAERGMGLVLITHDLRVAFNVCERIYVLYAGSLVEVASAGEIASEPRHPYTLGLLLSEPSVDHRQADLTTIEGSVPRPDAVATMCSFAPRCHWVADECRSEKPRLASTGADRLTACIRIDEIAADMATARVAAQTDPLPSTATQESRSVLRVENLEKVFRSKGGRPVNALSGVTIEIGFNESVGLVGESGSGKTTLGRCVVGLETATAGRVLLEGKDVTDMLKLARDDRRALRQAVQIVFQDPYSSLDPMQKVGSCIGEVLAMYGTPKAAIRTRVRELLAEVGLPASYAERMPAALSGGERQRVAIARALAVGPKLLICDEPVSALDVSVQAQILKLFRSLRERLKLSYLFITHDLAVVRQVVDRVYVLYRGELVEQGPVDSVLDRPQHPYTARLVASVPSSRMFLDDEFETAPPPGAEG